MDMVKASLEDIFIELTGGEAEEAGQTPSEGTPTGNTPAADDAEGRESEVSGE